MKFKVKSQLYSDSEAQLKGAKQILDDCGPSSTAAMVAWASKYELDPSAADGVAAKQKATGYVDKQGVADNGSSVGDLIKTAKVLGAHARFANSWEDVVESAKNGAAIGVWVQQPIGYPDGIEISQWHENWKKWWKKTDPSHLREGYGHMTAAGWDPEEGWMWCCPTRSGKGKEQYGVNVTEEELRKIADSKRVSGVHKAPDYKHCIIVTYKSKVAAAAPVIEQSNEPKQDVKPVVAVQPKQVLKKSIPSVAKKDDGIKVDLSALDNVDWDRVAADAGKAIAGAADAAKEEKTMFGKLKIALYWIMANTGIDEMVFEALRAFLATSIAVALGLGIPLLDISGGDFRTVMSAGLAACLQVVVRALNPEDSKFGLGKAKSAKAKEEDPAA
jgi:hypothetical protein